jgi:pyridoxine kinase
MEYNRILTIQDISCLGQCSMTVALPVLSACGQETCILPSAILSTHTGGFTAPAVQNLTELLPRGQAHWQRENITFDAVYTGYLGSTGHIACVESIFTSVLAQGGKIIVDPAMADHGKLYKGFDRTYADAMADLCRKADVVLPNLTEACMLTETEYREVYDEAYIGHVVGKLHEMGIPCVVLTGVGYSSEETGVLISSQEGICTYCHPKIARGYHGTGDLFAAAFVGSWLGGKPMTEAAQIAADFVCQCIRNTADDESHCYGVKFETALPYLIKRLYE